ncbi:hypothetical protein C8R45DRAFT_1080679 [Mycena sanguinolenta]|nr:hypothetical protein C8R45DRAFT_1080679 [Mycena sanguinolenta]
MKTGRRCPRGESTMCSLARVKVTSSTIAMKNHKTIELENDRIKQCATPRIGRTQPTKVKQAQAAFIQPGRDATAVVHSIHNGGKRDQNSTHDRYREKARNHKQPPLRKIKLRSRNASRHDAPARHEIKYEPRREKNKKKCAGSETRRKTECESQNGHQARGIHGGVEREEKRATKKTDMPRSKRVKQGMQRGVLYHESLATKGLKSTCSVRERKQNKEERNAKSPNHFRRKPRRCLVPAHHQARLLVRLRRRHGCAAVVLVVVLDAVVVGLLAVSSLLAIASVDDVNVEPISSSSAPMLSF